MLTSSNSRWALLIAANAMFLCMLSFYRESSAQQGRDTPPPFANSVQQRFEMIAAQKKTNELLAEQNALLRSGNLRVVLNLPEQR